MLHQEKAHALRTLEEEMIANKVTPELADQPAHLVMGDGNFNASIFFIGEAPGKKEDEIRLPFQGSAGKFLNEMIEAAGMERSDVYITNIVKYRPPKNRDPSEAEKQAFWLYLLKELEIIQPKVIITLGRVSMSHFLPDASIGEVHGQLFNIKVNNQEYMYIPLYHPSAATYNRQLRQTLIDDFVKVPEMIKSL